MRFAGGLHLEAIIAGGVRSGCGNLGLRASRFRSRTSDSSPGFRGHRESESRPIPTPGPDTQSLLPFQPLQETLQFAGRSVLNFKVALVPGCFNASSAECRNSGQRRLEFSGCLGFSFADWRWSRAGAVEYIAGDRMSQGRHVNANLMGASGIDLHSSRVKFPQSVTRRRTTR